MRTVPDKLADNLSRTEAVIDGLTDVPGIEVGHAEDLEARTGCTVVLCRAGAVVGVDVRGAAPGTRETDLCRPGTLVERGHAVLLAGGSAFGLNAASGVMRFLWEQGIGFDTGVARVPIVPGAVIFDFGVGQVAWPDDAMGYAACTHASRAEVSQGSVGAGTGATVGKMLGATAASKGGIGSASIQIAGMTVAALIVVNAFGDVVSPTSGEILAGVRAPDGTFMDTTAHLLSQHSGPVPATNTTIGVVATDARLSSEQVNHLATVAHDGLARAIRPVHTMYDGDTIFALSTGEAAQDWGRGMLSLEAAVVAVTERAIVRAVQLAQASPGPY